MYFILNFYINNIYIQCEGGTGNFTCAEGHVGALCEACDIYGKMWN